MPTNAYLIRHTERYDPGVAVGENNPEYPSNWDAVLTLQGFDHAKMLVEKFINVCYEGL